MKTDAAFVRSDGIVVLNPIAAVGPKIAVIVFPVYAENNNTVRFGESFKDSGFMINRMVLNKRHYIACHFVNCLMKFRLVMIASQKAIHKPTQLFFYRCIHD